MADEQESTLADKVRVLAGADAAGVSEPQLQAIVDTSQMLVGTFKPPEDKADQLTVLWSCHVLAAKLANLGTVKINGVWIEAESEGSNPWYDQFYLLLQGLGLGRSKVVGW